MPGSGSSAGVVRAETDRQSAVADSGRNGLPAVAVPCQDHRSGAPSIADGRQLRADRRPAVGRYRPPARTASEVRSGTRDHATDSSVEDGPDLDR